MQSRDNIAFPFGNSFHDKQLEKQQATWGFAIVGLEVRTISSIAYPSFGSGRTSNIGH